MDIRPCIGSHGTRALDTSTSNRNMLVLLEDSPKPLLMHEENKLQDVVSTRGTVAIAALAKTDLERDLDQAGFAAAECLTYKF